MALSWALLTSQYQVLDEILQLLVQEAQKYPSGSRERKTVTTKLWGIIQPGPWSSTPTDGVAKKRLKGVKNSLLNEYISKSLSLGFLKDCWDEAFSEIQLEFLQKIDIYQRGIDFKLFGTWQNFCKEIAAISPRTESSLQPVCEEFSKAVDDWQERLNKRMSQRQDYNP